MNQPALCLPPTFLYCTAMHSPGRPYSKAFSASVPPDCEGRRLDAFAAALTPALGQRGAKRLAARGGILVNGKARAAHYKLTTGDEVTIVAGMAESPAEGHIHLSAAVAGYAAFAKPAGLHTASIAASGTNSLEGLIQAEWSAAYASRPFAGGDALPLPPVTAAVMNALNSLDEPPCSMRPLSAPLPMEPPHLLGRLDRATSGIVPAAFSLENARAFREQEGLGAVSKFYLALVRGTPSAMTIRTALDTDGRKKTRALAQETTDATRHTEVYPLHAVARVTLLAETKLTLVAARIRRGARHQIRAHLAHAGFPLLGDPLYGEAAPDLPLYLHHARITAPEFCFVLPPQWLEEACALP